MKIILSALLLGCLATPCFADEFLDSGVQFSQRCHTVPGFIVQGRATDEHMAPEIAVMCIYYTRGAVDGLFTGFSLSNLPEDLTTTQIMLITLRYIDQHPEEANEPTVDLMKAALRESYPPSQH
jgi:hypothetical protein